MRRWICILLIFIALPLSAQVDRREVRSGNRKFRKGSFPEAELLVYLKTLALCEGLDGHNGSRVA